MSRKFTIAAILFLLLLADLILVHHSIIFNQISNFNVLITLSFQIFIGILIIAVLGIIFLKPNFNMLRF